MVEVVITQIIIKENEWFSRSADKFIDIITYLVSVIDIDVRSVIVDMNKLW